MIDNAVNLIIGQYVVWTYGLITAAGKVESFIPGTNISYGIAYISVIKSIGFLEGHKIAINCNNIVAVRNTETEILEDYFIELL